MLSLFKRIGIASAGVMLILVGTVLLVLPGPGLLLIAAGFGLLATEFPVVRRLVDRILASRPFVAARSSSPWLRIETRVGQWRDARRHKSSTT
jgi:putative transmembrane protein PGPGW